MHGCLRVIAGIFLAKRRKEEASFRPDETKGKRTKASSFHNFEMGFMSRCAIHILPSENDHKTFPQKIVYL